MHGARLIGVIAGTVLCVSAQAQNTLGDGRGLENNDISVTKFKTRTNASNALLERIRLRNAVVTGNAPGGLSFRGDAGYLAPGEFRGELGANDLFAFRRDSLYSGLSGYGIRGTEAMQWQFALTTDAKAPSGLLGSPTVQRFGTPRLDDQQDRLTGLRDSDLLRPDPIESQIEAMRAPGGTLMGSLRSTSAYTVSRASTTTLLAAGQSELGNRFGVTASPLEGVRIQELETPAWMAGTDGSLLTPGTPNRIDPLSTAKPVTPTRTAYDDVLERLRANTIPDPLQTEPQKPAWQQKLDEIRAQVAADLFAGAADTDGDGAQDSGISNEALELIRSAGGLADNLIVGTGEGFDPYANHVRQAQDLLTAGQYFDAEERFTRALSIRSNDVSAQVGRVHAQLGAGMYVSASMNLRSLVGSNPEITGVRYGPALLPETKRISDIVRVLRNNTNKQGASALKQESALLLAYLGAQTGDRSLTREGLDLFEVNASTSDRRLGNLLRGVWLAPMTPEAGDPGR